MPNRLAVGWLRALLAVLLLFGSEIVLWRNPSARDLPEWFLLAGGYLALGTLLLDALVRFRVRDMFAGLLLAGVYGLAQALLFAPATPDLDLFYHLVTLALGAHTLLGAASLGLWIMLLRGHIGRGVWVGSALVGLAWGVWVRWGPIETTLPMMLAYGAAVLLLALLLWVMSRPRLGALLDLRLSLLEGLLVLVALGVIFVLQSSFTVFDPLFTITGIILLAYCGLILWYQTSARPVSVFSIMQPLAPLPVRTAAMLFLLGGTAGYLFPFAPDGQQRDVIIALFSTFGLVWLPTVSLVLGIRAYRRQTRQKQL